MSKKRNVSSGDYLSIEEQIVNCKSKSHVSSELRSCCSYKCSVIGEPPAPAQRAVSWTLGTDRADARLAEININNQALILGQIC